MTPEIASALRTLYGRPIPVSPGFIETLRPEKIKALFRRRARELHPDRAALLGKNPGEMSEAFKEMKLAYERILHLIGSPPEKPSGRAKNTPPERQRPEPHHPGDHFWEAGVPEKNLLLGQFLYYSGLISFNHLVSAITWQRSQRPTFGKIARMWGYLTEKETIFLIHNRGFGERMGEAALRFGTMSPFQISAVLRFQECLQRPIGEYFLQAGLLEAGEIPFLVRLARKHNMRVRKGERPKGTGGE